MRRSLASYLPSAWCRRTHRRASLWLRWKERRMVQAWKREIGRRVPGEVDPWLEALIEARRRPDTPRGG